ncbi:L-lactate dehydrogenase [Gilvimarinus sp. SDUM040013]|uniref:L-lactate dehydrogenase n=1 Tax=Gilvimarinus gilvus TaxID=3058038 RepID=A0ABU4S5T3_9GAMM|nr:L-lactate dehydrogenase [Gilvimarinus sp. SDUM040013]MDO3384946.1 L-lactate dehydrogenase [Gilvimarinus sp. SDUM040013]MDX6851258.1 L-lactate dehydrogenase [Gilvimarinus sp. SDUM040013]
MIPASVSDYRTLAQRRLPKFLFEYIDGGAFSESTLRRNESDFEHYRLRQRILRNVDNVDTSTEILGQHVALPLVLAPVGIAGLNARRGEVQAVKAAHGAGVPFCLSTVSACSVEEVAASAPSDFWFQLYMIRDRGFLDAMLERAWAAGCRTLIFTVDMPVPATRYRDIRSGLSGGTALRRKLARASQAMLKPRWAWDVGLWGRPHNLGNIAPILGENAGIDEFWRWMAENFDPRVTWDDMAVIREKWQGKLVIKGILDADDAMAARDTGADGIVISNHGGRQLDGASSSIAALPAISAAVAGDLDILLDSGVRTGVDIVRALALGASGVMIGRPWVYGLAARGERGVADIIDIFAKEMRVAMALTGQQGVAGLTRDILLEE